VDYKDCCTEKTEKRKIVWADTILVLKVTRFSLLPLMERIVLFWSLNTTSQRTSCTFLKRRIPKWPSTWLPLPYIQPSCFLHRQPILCWMVQQHCTVLKPPERQDRKDKNMFVDGGFLAIKQSNAELDMLVLPR
jgi:hypothetical protein